MAAYGAGRYGRNRYGGGFGTNTPVSTVRSGPISITGTALMQAAGTRVVHSNPVSMTGTATVGVTITPSLPLTGNIQVKFEPAAYFRAVVAPTTPESLGLTPVFIQRVSPIMPDPTLSNGRPV